MIKYMDLALSNFLNSQFNLGFGSVEKYTNYLAYYITGYHTKHIKLRERHNSVTCIQKQVFTAHEKHEISNIKEHIA